MSCFLLGITVSCNLKKSTLLKSSGVTRGWGQTAPGDTLQGGDTRRKKKILCGQIYKELWRNEVGQVKKVWGDTLEGVTPE